MSVSLDIRVLELLAARLCHELAGPISAVVNGVELMGEEDPDFVAEAVRLVGTSARTASRRLNSIASPMARCRAMARRTRSAASWR